MEEKTYWNKILWLLGCISILILLLFINISLTNNYTLQLDGINSILAFIAIPCTIVYYDINKPNILFTYILIYIILFIQRLCKLIMLNLNIYIDGELATPFIYRCLLLILIVYVSDNFHKFLIANKIKIVLSTLISSISLITIEILLRLHFDINKYIGILSVIFLIIYFFTILKLLVRSLHEHNFILTIYNFSLMILFLSSTRYILAHFHPINMALFIDSFFAVSLGTVILGLFIEMKHLIIENQRLTKDVESISNDIKEYKFLEKVRSQFFANLSHELKTPLNIIFSFVQLLDTKDKNDYYGIGQSYSKYSNSIMQNSYRLVRLINNLIDLTKIDSGFMNITYHNHDIVNLVETITMSVVPYMENKNLNIVFDTYVEELEIRCDSDCIERIILNLLSNSIKFSRENGNILVLMDSDDDYVTITISDDGIGIEKEYLEKVFDIFIQTDKSMTRNNEGSGIGLSLAKSLVLLHEGEIYIDSELDKGTKITIRLPNKIIENDTLTFDDKINNSNKDLVSKIKIEFSDIYNLDNIF